jgi:hypothetical protein
MTATRAVTMWDFSWLLRRFGEEAEYADTQRVLDELADRGYDVVRIDAFPHWIAADRTGAHLEHIVAEPQSAGFMWGNHARVTVEPRAALLEFLSGLAERGIQAGLSTWFTPDSTGRAEEIEAPADLARVWIETLRVIDDAGLLGTVAYVDLCNEWPAWAPGIGRRIFGDIGSVFALPRPLATAELAGVDSYAESLQKVKGAFPGIPLTFSSFLRGPVDPLRSDLMRLSTTGYDFAEPHLWLTAGCPQFIEETRWTSDYEHHHRDLAIHQAAVRERYGERRDAYLAELAVLLDEWRDWATDRDLPLWTTEGWASVGWNPELVPGWDGWDYVKDVAEQAIGMALERGWQGICTSNFSQPHHVGMWADSDWHRQQTSRIRKTSWKEAAG